MPNRKYIVVKKGLSHSQISEAKELVLHTGIYEVKDNRVLVCSTGAYIGYLGKTTLEIVQDEHNPSARHFRKNLEKIFNSAF